MPRKRQIFCALSLMLAAAVVLSAASAAEKPSVLVLDVGLDDDTLLPRVPDEVARTAMIAPYIRSRLTEIGYQVVPYQGNADTLARTANGYLLAHPAEVAAIGRAVEADWVALGVQRKFSFLISWLRVYLIDTRKNTVVGRAEADLRGAMTDKRMTHRAAVSLADQIDAMLVTIAQRRRGEASP